MVRRMLVEGWDGLAKVGTVEFRSWDECSLSGGICAYLLE
jgi:hypothetical protein